MSATFHSDHRHGRSSDERRVLAALAITTLFMMVEAAGGLLAGSLALLADAAHMLADVLALMMAYAAFRLGRLAADAQRTYGYRRLEVLAALVNGITVVGLSAWILVEAAFRLARPGAVEGWPMLIVAAIGLAANFATWRILAAGRGGRPANLNLRGAVLHVLGDLLASAAALVAATVILATDWTPIDPLLSIVIALLIAANGVGVIRAAGHILLEGSPPEFDPARLRAALLAEVAGLIEVHHLHAWSVSSTLPMITLHAVIEPSADRDAVLDAVKHVLGQDFGFSHSVVQIETAGCRDGDCR
jgi:cobalt-zinc-cadmium efflux system protein